MSYVPPNQPFDFGRAVTMPFQTSGGAAFAKRVWFWMTIPIVLGLLIAVPLMAPHYGAMMAWYAEYMEIALSGAEPDVELMADGLDKVGAMMPGYIVMFAGLWIGAVMGEAALHRKALRGVELPGRPVRFGGDELRVMGAQICVWAILFAILFVGSIVAGIGVGILAAILGPVGAALGAFSVFVIFYFVINFAVRLMPLAALSVKSGTLNVGAARALTKGKFWPLFGAFVLTYIVGSIAASVFSGLGSFIVFGGSDLAGTLMETGGDVSAIMDVAAERIKNPLIVFGGIICIIAYAAIMSLMFLSLSGIGTYAAEWAQGNDAGKTFE